MQGKVEICGVNTSRLPVLKNEEARALLLRAKAGDAAAVSYTHLDVYKRQVWSRAPLMNVTGYLFTICE